MIIVKISLRWEINETTHGWCFFYVISYMDENSILLFYYIYFTLVLEVM